jgi:hypothetical protein
MSCRPDKARWVWFFRAAGKGGETGQNSGRGLVPLPGYVREPQALIAAAQERKIPASSS